MKELAETDRQGMAARNLEKSRYPWFHISIGTGWYHHHISWNDNLDIPFDSIRTHINSIKEGKEAWQTHRKTHQGTGQDCRRIQKTDQEPMMTGRHLNRCLAWHRMVSSLCGRPPFLRRALVPQYLLGKGPPDWSDVPECRLLSRMRDEDIWFMKRDEIKQALWDLLHCLGNGSKGEGPLILAQRNRMEKGRLRKIQRMVATSCPGSPA